MQQKKSSTSSRRGFVTGTVAVGAATAAATSAMPFLKSERQADAQTQPPPKPERGGGYSLSEHVKHYYRTTLI